jgi:hypothetical protein
MRILMAALFIVFAFVGVWCLFGFWGWLEYERFWRQLGGRR